MALKLLAFLVVIKLALSVAVPEPENNNINVDVQQVVNAGSGCCPGSCCPETGMNKMACDIAGGKCQKIGEPCKGCLQKGDLWCEDHDYACCTPRGCTWGSVSYKNGSYLDTSRFDHCANYTCNDGKWDLVGQQNCINDYCGCINGGTLDDPGCILAYPNLPGLACNCTLVYEDQFPTCYGTIVQCMIWGSYYCDNTGTDKGFCMQGMGNCDGY